jgi:glycerophosphodiester phosphodiesterase
MGALLELRGQLRKLQWFGEVNRMGFLKITKKLDKKVSKKPTQQRYIETKVDPRPFATNAALFEDMKTINNWLSALGNAKNQEDAKSIHSVHSLKRVSSGSILNLPAGLLDTVDKAVRNDDVPILEETLMEANLDIQDPAFQKLQLNLLQRSISSKSKGCIGYLLRHLKTLDDVEDINQRNCIHRLAISIGRSKSKTARLQDQEDNPEVFTPSEYITPATHPGRIPKDRHNPEIGLLGMEDESVQILSYVLDHMQPNQRGALKARDSYGRMPLHYGAQSGIVIVCKLLMAHMQEWGQFNVERGIDAPEWQDNESLAPLHLSVIGGHPLTTKALLDAENWKGSNSEKAAMRRNISQSSAVLALATKSNFVIIVKLLVDAGVDINWQDEMGETALHVAARFGHAECARLLLDGTVDQKVDVELVEKAFAWTPLHIASVDGHLQVAELLVAAGAEINKPDASGWTAREHAALRGHMDIAEFLAVAASRATSTREYSSSASEDSVSTAASSPPSGSSLEERRSHASEGHALSRSPEPVKTFGHRYLTNESLVLVSLGSMDMRKNVEAVKLDRIPMADAHSTQLDTALSLVVSAKGAQGEPTIIDLPVQDNISTEPIVFTTLDASKVKLYFDIIPTYSGGHEHKVGRGVALLNSLKPTIGLKRMNLQGDISVPIVAASTLEVIGCVNFNFLVITPFSHPNMEITEKQTYWKKMSSTMVIGHRGLGKNATSNKSLQLGENTIQSFIAAANLGANYVEFDVQLTKDHVPVIYHDFLVSETGIDAPVHTLTLEQFLHVNERNTSRTSRTPSPDRIKNAVLEKVRNAEGVYRPRSLSMGYAITESDMDERMKHTRDFKEKGFKANTRGHFIQAPFTTLEEMFKKLPEEVGFNIEMKYPMLFESEEQEMDTYAVELNSFCDTVLTKVYDLGKKRNIIFSSFNPDICLLLSFKQPSIPILFLTDAGISPVGDIRASSLQEAIRFASRWNLLGVVSAAEPLCNSPRLVRVVKESGLVCVSYGVLNNDPVKVQVCSTFSSGRSHTDANKPIATS